MPELIIPVGIPGSGKSTFVDNVYLLNTHTILCLDDMRLATGSIFNPKVEPLLKGMYKVMGRALMIRGQNIVLDSTNVSYHITKEWVDMAKEYNYSTVIILMKTDIDVCKERQTKNVPTDKIHSFSNQMKDLIDQIDDFGVTEIYEVVEGEIKKWD